MAKGGGGRRGDVLFYPRVSMSPRRFFPPLPLFIHSRFSAPLRLTLLRVCGARPIQRRISRQMLPIMLPLK